MSWDLQLIKTETNKEEKLVDCQFLPFDPEEIYQKLKIIFPEMRNLGGFLSVRSNACDFDLSFDDDQPAFALVLGLHEVRPGFPFLRKICDALGCRAFDVADCHFVNPDEDDPDEW